MKLGRVRWVAPSGLVGFGPLASVGPVSLGPGAAEKSSLEIPRVVVCVDPLQSLLQRKLILHLLADQAQVGSSTPLQPRCTVCGCFGSSWIWIISLKMRESRPCPDVKLQGPGLSMDRDETSALHRFAKSILLVEPAGVLGPSRQLCLVWLP